MKKSIIIVLGVVILCLIVGGYYLYRQVEFNSQEDKASTSLPSVSTNPLGDKPDINPINQANPFTNIKTNPFDK